MCLLLRLVYCKREGTGNRRGSPPRSIVCRWVDGKLIPVLQPGESVKYAAVFSVEFDK